MVTSPRFTLIGIASLIIAGASQSGGPAEVRAIIDKAIEAHGGAAVLTKYPSKTFKATGNFYGLGEGIPYTGEWAMQWPKQTRFALEIKANGQTVKVLSVLNGDKGWKKINDADAVLMSKEQLAEEQASAYSGWVQSLVPLKDKAFELSLIGEAKVLEKPAIGVRVARKERRDISLYFDKKSGLLVQAEMRVKDGMTGQEFTQTTIFHDHKAIQGFMHATKILILKDGKRLIDGVMTEFRPHEKLDDATFAKP